LGTLRRRHGRISANALGGCPEPKEVGITWTEKARELGSTPS
jgi:hypothetical protein